MPDLALNGNHSPCHDTVQRPSDEVAISVEYDAFHNFTDSEPPLKRRKLVEDEGSHKSSPRAPSPPWKKFVAEGPTSFVEDGRRKSGRTNLIPLEQQPQSSRRQTRAHRDTATDKQTRPVYNNNNNVKKLVENGAGRPGPKSEQPFKRGPGRPPKIKVEGGDKATIKSAYGKQTRRISSRVTQKQSPVSRRVEYTKSESSTTDQTDSSSNYPSPPLTFQKVKFRVALPKPSVMTPANITAPKKYTTFEEFLDHDPHEPFHGQSSLTQTQIYNEALSRHRVNQARLSGQMRHGTSAYALPDKQLEPRRQYAHRDHLLVHALHFRSLLLQEQRDHKKKAEQLAQEAKKYLEDKRRKGRVKSAEELAREHVEHMRAQYKGIVKDIDRLWMSVEAEVNADRLRRYEEEQQARIKGHLNRVLDRTDQMLQRKEDSDIATDANDTETESGESGKEAERSDSEDLSDSSSESEMEIEPDDPDAGLDTKELRAKYENIPDLEKIERNDDDAEGDEHTRMEASDTNEDSDPETEMDSEFESDNSHNSDEDRTDDDSNEDEDVGMGDGLLSLLFNKKQISDMKSATPEVELDKNQEREVQAQILGIEPLVVELPDDSILDNHPTAGVINAFPLAATAQELSRDGGSQEPSVQTSPQTSVSRRTEPESVSSFEPRPDSQLPDTPRDDKSFTKTPVPTLLRGTLREYQHEGLDWLANLYATGRSGILADEMGLGKTIQSIALLAHLATQYEVWGPHLIVVPTSVMLNWEMEFKKFLPGFKILTYYGNLEERKQKRRGWMADDSFNVCITSYQLVLQDANSFKRRKWHYMILDEAHNIKNFRSERWQTMMTFNTRARLLLTGTPLQNNLTELWSLLFFLHYGQEGEDNDDAFAGLKEWSEWFKRPVESILEHGRQVLDAEDKEQVAKHHKVIRPFLLRRLKADVEKQMPLKYEHVEMCRLSKRQRQLYDGFMSRAQTKETLASGNYLSIINALMQLRKVCNHPDLFETRPINTSFAMSRSVVADFEIQDLIVRKKLFAVDPLDEVDLDFLQLVPISNEKISSIENLETLRRHAYGPIKALRDSQSQRLNRHAVASSHSCEQVLTLLDNNGRRARLQDLDRTVYYEAYRHHQRPIYGRGLLQKLDIDTSLKTLTKRPSKTMTRIWERGPPAVLLDLVSSTDERSRTMKPLVEQYACVTPTVIAADLNTSTVSEVGAASIRRDIASLPDPFHQARMKLSIAFPDKRLLQYDCGKLQRLDKLLRKLQAGGHRALIFTQMTKVLDILEQFLNIHGHRYLRLDGATKIEQRQILTDRFNNDTRILAFILSSRSGGLGINLTGADTVIFYDLDWNPAMDRQCTDRAHRIGQTRDVHIYRFVSEHTIESNILRKANQKQLLDDVVIQEGEFTTDYRNKVTYRDMLEDNAENDAAGAAMDRVLGNDKSAVAAFEHAEDKEDVSAAKVAAKEVQHADDGDFEEKVAATPDAGADQLGGPFEATDAAIAEADSEDIHHIDDYLLKMQAYLLKDIPLIHPKDRSKRGRKRADDHRRRKQR